MDLFSLSAKLALDSSEYNNGIGKAEGALSKLGGFAKKTGVAVAGMLTASAGAVMGLTKSAVEAYAEYEQLVGGIETLFKSSADESGSVANKVLENAQKAYETAGMSANEYMDTVASFSASLIQSTGRGAQTDLEALKATLDEEYDATKRSLEDQYAERKSYWDERIRLEKNKDAKQALKEGRDAALKELKRQNEDSLKEMKKHNKEALAEAERANMSSETSEESLQRASELADMAIIDMSDNANKMGTDIEMIKNAYAGFAKQNYTMLDNLKLGYGGTKEEMERLLADAEELTGKKYDMSSYADIVEAIHAIQTEMGITGTTAEEAEHTISGSAKAMKSAWQNMLVTFADRKGDTKKATANLVRTAKNFYSNIAPVVQQTISGIGDFFTEIAPMVGEELPKLIVDVVPKMFNAGKKLISGLVKGAKSAVNKTKVATWLGMADENGNVPDDVSWGDIGRRVIEKIKEKVSEGKIKIADMLGIEDAEDATWGDIAGNIRDRIKEKLKSAKIKIASILGVDEPESASWASIAIKLKDRLKNALGNLKIKLADLLGITKEGVGTEADWADIGKEIISKLTSYFSHKGDFLAKLILGDEFESLGADENKWVKVGEKISGWLTEAFADGGLLNAILTGGAEKIAGIASFAGELISGFATWIANNADEVSGIITSIAGAIAKSAEPIVNALVTILTNPDVINAIGDAMLAVLSVIFGEDFVSGLKKFLGISSGEGGLLNNTKAQGRSDEFGRLTFGTIEQRQENLDKFAEGFQKDLENAEFSAEEIALIMNKIRSTDVSDIWDVNATAQFIKKLDDMKEKEKALQEELEKLPSSKTVEVNLVANDPDNLLDILSGYSGGGGGGKPNMAMLNAKGNWSVPYDGFLANLHRGEMVLTKSQARDYREGGSGIDVAGLESAIESAIRRGIEGVSVRSFLNGKDITAEVNRNNINDVKGRRFAT